MLLRISNILSVILMAVALSFPLWLSYFEFEDRPLVGVYERQEKPAFNPGSWQSGAFQEAMAVYATENFPHYDTLIRINNQWRFALLNESSGSEVVIGKEGYLYEPSYIHAVNGKDYIGDEEIGKRTSELRRIQDALCEGGVESFVVFAPGKGSFYPEHIPDRYFSAVDTTNYDAFRTEMDRLQVNYIDLRQWFIQMKDTSQYALFPKTGVHWSKYGELLAADSIFHYISSLIHEPVPELNIRSVNVPDTVSYEDKDAERLMNLCYDLPNMPMGYAKWTVDADSTHRKPKVIVISDSYFWGMFNLGFSESVMDQGRFWYYGHTIYPDDYYTRCFVEDVSVPLELLSTDVVIWMATDANLWRFPYKVPEKFLGE